MLDGPAASAFLTQSLIEAFGLFDLATGRAYAKRHVARHLVVFPDWIGIRHHPIKVAVLATVFDHPLPSLAGLECAPKVFIRFNRHVRVADNVVRGPEEFGLAESADFNEGTVDEGYSAL